MTKAISSSDKYVYTFCFAKLNRLSKIDFDLENRIETLKKEKNEVLSALRGKINLTQNSKRQIIHSPTPRKLKRIPPSSSTPQSQATCKTTNTVQETPKTSKRRRLFYLDPPEDSVRVRVYYGNFLLNPFALTLALIHNLTICIVCWFFKYQGQFFIENEECMH